MKQAAKIAKLYGLLEPLDKEIIKVKKAAMEVANNPDVTIKMNFTLEKPTEPGKESILDSDGSLVNHKTYKHLNPFQYTFGFGISVTKESDIKTDEKTFTPTDTMALQILGIMLGEMYERRNGIVAEIEKTMRETA